MRDLLVIEPEGMDGEPWLGICSFTPEFVEDAGWSFLIERVEQLAEHQDVTLTGDAQWWVGDPRSPPYGFPYRRRPRDLL